MACTNNFNKEIKTITPRHKYIVIGFLKKITKNIANDIILIICLYFYETLIIKQNEKYNIENNDNQYFNSILIKKHGILSGCNKKLNITCFGDIVLNQHAQINLDGKGYRSRTREPNFGVGGGGYCGGGGGYGTKGSDGYGGGGGGNIYGDEKLSILHLGSGGGGCCYGGGGSGGGAVKIHCFGNIIMKEQSLLSCNGGDGGSFVGETGYASFGGGGGSGGSIHVIVDGVDNIKMNKSASIQSRGGRGRGGYGGSIGGDGGFGRIRVEFMSTDCCKYIATDYNIIPQPFVG